MEKNENQKVKSKTKMKTTEDTEQQLYNKERKTLSLKNLKY